MAQSPNKLQNSPKADAEAKLAVAGPNERQRSAFSNRDRAAGVRLARMAPSAPRLSAAGRGPQLWARRQRQSLHGVEPREPTFQSKAMSLMNNRHCGAQARRPGPVNL